MSLKTAKVKVKLKTDFTGSDMKIPKLLNLYLKSQL